MKLTDNLRNIEVQINELFANNNFGHVYFLSEWQKNGYHRIYVNRTNGRKNTTEGFIDLVKKEIQIKSWKINQIIEKYELI